MSTHGWYYSWCHTERLKGRSYELMFISCVCRYERLWSDKSDERAKPFIVYVTLASANCRTAGLLALPSNHTLLACGGPAIHQMWHSVGHLAKRTLQITLGPLADNFFKLTHLKPLLVSSIHGQSCHHSKMMRRPTRLVVGTVCKNLPLGRAGAQTCIEDSKKHTHLYLLPPWWCKQMLTVRYRHHQSLEKV